MTEDETDAGMGRLARRYAETKRKIACVRGRIDDVREAAETACRELRFLGTGESAAAKKAEFDAVPWLALSEWLGTLTKLEEEKTRLESCLRDAGLGDLIR